MKNKLLKSIMLSTLISTVGVGSVLAAEPVYENQPTNASDYSIKIKDAGKGGVVAHYTQIEVTGLTPKNLSNFYVKMVDKSAKSEEVSYASLTGDSDRLKALIRLNKSTEGILFNTIDDNFYTTSRDLYAYIYNCPSGVSVCKPTTTSPIKVERESLPELSNRYQIYVFPANSQTTNNYYASIFPLYPISASYPITNAATLKIGKIEDTALLKSLAKKEAGAMGKLLEYAKNATNGLSYTAQVNKFHDVDTSNLTVQNGSYYYLYISVDDPKNELIDLSDVSIVKAMKGNLVTNFTFDETDDLNAVHKDYEYACYQCTNEYVWTAKGYQAKTCTLVDSITEKSKCVKNVKTGVEDYILPGTITLIVGAGLVTLLNKKSRFKKI